MTAKREYPFGRVMQDTVAQPIRNKKLAAICREILERLTGEQCDVVPRGSVNWLLRYASERWIRA